MAPRSRPAIWYATTLASIAVGIVPIVILERQYGVPRKVTVGYGVLAWAVAVAAKAIIHHLVVDRAVRRGADHRLASVGLGTLSSAAELGVAAAFFVFVWRPPTFAQLIGFGAGAGMAEAVMMPFITNPYKGSTLEAHSTDVFARSASAPLIQWLNVLERVWAMSIHISSRALVYLTITSANPAPAAVAVCGFACVDGVAYYGLLQKWRFDQWPTLARVHACVGGIALVLTATLVLLAQWFDAGHAPVAQASDAGRSVLEAPRCVYRENGFRSSVNPPREVHREEPDLAGLPPLTGEQIAIIEVRIDATGRVTESCMLRGVREDVDRKALDAVKAWRFEPPRLRSDTEVGGSQLDAGTAVPIFMTVTMRLGRRP